MITIYSADSASVMPAHAAAFISYSWDDETRTAWVREWLLDCGAENSARLYQ